MSTPPLDRHFVLRKVHSLLGIVPIGAFLCFHLFENSLSVKGEAYFTEHVIHKIGDLPYVELMEIFFIALPILFHGIYGVIIWLQGKSNVTSYTYFRNWMYWVQRISGVIAFVFILTHVWGTRMQVLLNEEVTKDNLFEWMVTNFDKPWVVGWYIIGVLASIIHLSNGIWLALITWGFTVGPRSQRTSSWVCAGIGLALVVLSVQAMRGLMVPPEIVEAAVEAAESSH